jgi:hypothetical protein
MLFEGRLLIFRLGEIIICIFYGTPKVKEFLLV